jgi:hypothetical protein
MNEKEAEAKFDEIKKRIIQKFPGSTTNFQLNDYCKKLFKHRFVGVFASNKIRKLKKNQSCIINLDASHLPGSHWVSMCRDCNNNLYFYDSFARSIDNIIPILRRIYKNKYIFHDIKDTEQKKTESNCGANCVSWLVMFYKYGSYVIMKI